MLSFRGGLALEQSTCTLGTALARQCQMRRGAISSINIFSLAALEATQGQMDGVVSQLPYKCHLEEVASVGD